jgi:isopentenyl diphosphate isomerase/L-lactate dehydrogenase-like FMN-dependent dehydrogenase
VEFLQGFIAELKTAMFLTGCKRIADLRSADFVLRGRVREWLVARGVNVERKARVKR